MMSRLPLSSRFLVVSILAISCALIWRPAIAAKAAKAPSAAASSARPAPEQFVDGIAAIVNKHVITLGQLADKTAQVRLQMEQQGVPVPDAQALRHQVLQQMINTELQNQEALQLGIRVNDAQIEQATQTIAQRNRMNVVQLRKEIEATGMSWDAYREELREQIQQDTLRQRLVEDRITVSDSDIDAFLNSPVQANGAPIMAPVPPPPAEPEPPAPPVATGPELLELAQILVIVPDFASEAMVQEKRSYAESLLKKLRSGADFAGVAAASSEGPQALQGGDMGIRPLNDWPDLFVRTIKTLGPGQVSGVIQSGRGFHILKVLRRGYAQAPATRQSKQAQRKAQQAAQAAQAAAAQRAAAPQQPTGPMMVTQTHARHILIKTTKIMSDDQAREILLRLRERIQHGEKFGELAKRYSEDASAPQGGDLGWLSPGQTVPAFEQAMDALQDGQVSEPVKSPFGWHLIEVEERRTKNMEDEFRRMQARRELMQRRIGPAYEDWLDQLRGKAYIDNRLDKGNAKVAD
ncbi:peptidylprolyl isomerase [Alcaligenaceae bacterium CGII-47]|nr:peptidylprolyl isomerase [Alcaligenaceae bacterium CGII-47]